MIGQNRMYRHSITVYDRSYRLVKTISDRVDLEALGGPAADGPVRGAPVEAAFSPDARHAFVSNYSMYGPGYTREGSDRCSPGSAIDRSFVYRLDVGRLAVDRVARSLVDVFAAKQVTAYMGPRAQPPRRHSRAAVAGAAVGDLGGYSWLGMARPT
jgi:hypothetical protein